MSEITRAAARAAIGLVASALLWAGAPGDAQAKHHHRHWHVHHHARVETARFAAAQAPTHLGPMRYYGGPKSPMWRAPAN